MLKCGWVIETKSPSFVWDWLRFETIHGAYYMRLYSSKKEALEVLNEHRNKYARRVPERKYRIRYISQNIGRQLHV